MREFFPQNQKLPGIKLSEVEKLENYFVAIHALSSEERAAKLQSLGQENLQRMMGGKAQLALVHDVANIVSTDRLGPAIRELSNLARARVMYCLNKKEEAIKSLLDIGSNGDEKQRSEAFYEMGGILFIEGDFLKAIEAFETALDLGYDSRKVYIGLARIALARQEIDLAEAYLADAAAHGDKLAKTLWAAVIYKEGRQGEALGLLTAAVLEGRDMKALQTLEGLLKNSGRVTELIEIYLEIVKGGDLTAAKKVADLKDFKTVPEELMYEFAIETGKVAVQQKKNDAFYVVGGALFEAYENGYKKDEVKTIVDGLIALGNGNIANGFATLLYDKERKVAEAIKYLEIALKLGSTRALLNMGLVMRGIGDFTLAEKYFLLAMRSGDKDVISNSVKGLMDLYVQFGQMEKVYGLNDIIGEVGKEVRDDAMPKIISETTRNMVLIGKYGNLAEKNSTIN